MSETTSNRRDHEKVPPVIGTKASLPRRILAFPLVGMVLALMITIAAAWIGGQLTGRIDPGVNSPTSLLIALLFAGAVVLGYWLYCHFVERAPFRDFALAGWMRELGGGLSLGVLLFSAVVAGAWIAGAYGIRGINSWMTIWPHLAIAVTSGVAEEVFLRGIIFRHLEAVLGSGIALALSALLFGVLHLGNPNASWTAALAIAVEAGVLLGALYMLTRRLWAAIGMHAGWNFTQGWLYGLPVSGMRDDGLVDGVLDGPVWLTGGAFGLEASVLAMVIATAAGALVLRLAIARGHWVRPMWSRTNTQTKL